MSIQPIVSPAAIDHPSLDHLSLLTVRGADARTFLDSQLTRDIPPAGSAALAGYCSPKGRLLADLLVWTHGDAIALLLTRELAEPIAKRLRMYVLRAKVVIDDVTATTRIGGTLDATAPPLDHWQVAVATDTAWLRLPDVDGRRRHLRIGDATHGGTGTGAAHWRWLDIRSGLPHIGLATQDRFVPQMLNLEALGAVDFKKGCFPGQEVVARSQYLGKLKRRMALASIEAGAPVPVPGSDVWAVDDREACGLVVNAEAGPGGRIALLVELPLAAFASTTLRAGTPDGAALRIDPLPYALPDNEVFVRPKL